MEYEFYKNFNTKNFSTILHKKEFNVTKDNHIYQDPHQLFLRNYISSPTFYDNMLLFHDVGVGKTCASISIAEGLKDYILGLDSKITVLIKNKNIYKNFLNELNSKCANYMDDDDYELATSQINNTYRFITYKSFVNKVLGRRKKGIEHRILSDQIESFNNSVIIIDEAHNFSNNELYTALKKVLSNSYNYRLILLTATPIYDNVKEIFEISNILNIKSNQAPIRDKLTSSKYLEKSQSPYFYKDIFKNELYKISNEGKDFLIQNLKGKVSFVPQNKKTNPKQIDMGTPIIPNRVGSTKVIFCEMSDYQYNIYKMAVKDDLNKKGSGNLYKNSNDASTIVYPNESYKHKSENIDSIFSKNNICKYSAKLCVILDNLNKNKGTHFIYSNYVTAGGTYLIEKLLLQNGYTNYEKNNNKKFKSYIIFKDSMSIENREKYRKILNKPENKDGQYIKIVIGSPMTSEGVTFKNIRNVHILEPHWNMSLINQVIGRAVRNNSHIDLPTEEQYVSVYKYVAIKSNISDFFIDKEKYILSEEKDRSNKIVERLLKEISIDCINNNILDGIENEQSCDYMGCELNCQIKKHTSNIDYSTYDLDINIFEKENINYAKNEIQKLFKLNFIWTLDDILENIQNITNIVIYTSLTDMIKNKEIIYDIFNRPGYIININDFYIFNMDSKNITNSFYSRFFNFSNNKSKYTLSEFVDKFVKKKEKEKSKKISVVNTDTPNDNNNLTDDIISYNDNLLENNNILGSYRKRPVKDEKYGLFDGVLRIIKKDKDQTDDKRKLISGTNIETLNKNSLLEIANDLNISYNKNKKYSKIELIDIIKNYLIINNLVLK